MSVRVVLRYAVAFHILVAVYSQSVGSLDWLTKGVVGGIQPSASSMSTDEDTVTQTTVTQDHSKSTFIPTTPTPITTPVTTLKPKPNIHLVYIRQMIDAIFRFLRGRRTFPHQRLCYLPILWNSPVWTRRRRLIPCAILSRMRFLTRRPIWRSRFFSRPSRGRPHWYSPPLFAGRRYASSLGRAGPEKNLRMRGRKITSTTRGRKRKRKFPLRSKKRSSRRNKVARKRPFPVRRTRARANTKPKRRSRIRSRRVKSKPRSRRGRRNHRRRG